MSLPQFTDRALKALEYAKKCARSLNQGYVGTEHILFGLTREGTSVAAKVLLEHEVTGQKIMDMIEECVRAMLGKYL